MHSTLLAEPVATATSRPARQPVAWAWAGFAAGLLGVGAIAFSTALNAVYDESLKADPARILAKLSGQSAYVELFHVCAMGAALTAVVFGLGLRRLLARRLPLGNLAPELAATGMALVAAVQILGTGFDTELFSGLVGYGGDGPAMVPEFAVVANHWIGTVPWMWTGAGLTAAAVAHAALRHGVFGKAVGVSSAGLGGLCLLLSVSPLQYMAGPAAVLWLLVTAPALVRAARRA